MYDFIFIFIINAIFFNYLFNYYYFFRLFFLDEISYTATLVNPRWNKGDVKKKTRSQGLVKTQVSPLRRFACPPDILAGEKQLTLK